jgi:hypothetical protein
MSPSRLACVWPLFREQICVDVGSWSGPHPSRRTYVPCEFGSTRTCHPEECHLHHVPISAKTMSGERSETRQSDSHGLLSMLSLMLKHSERKWARRKKVNSLHVSPLQPAARSPSRLLVHSSPAVFLSPTAPSGQWRLVMKRETASLCRRR